MLASVLVNMLLHHINESGDFPVVLNEEDGWLASEVEVGEDDNGNPIFVLYDVAH